MIKNGIPFDTAHDLVHGGLELEIEALAYSVVFGQFEGGEMDWTRMKWREKKQ